MVGLAALSSLPVDTFPPQTSLLLGDCRPRVEPLPRHGSNYSGHELTRDNA